MAVKLSKKDDRNKKGARRPVLSAISVAGYKSLENEQRMEIAPLTVLAGANSGGKSSIMQPVLLLKQTIDAPYDPGSLLLDGPNVRLTSADQLLSKKSSSTSTSKFSIKFKIGNRTIGLCFHKVPRIGLEIFSNSVSEDGKETVITKNATKEDLDVFVGASEYKSVFPSDFFTGAKASISRDRSFLSVELSDAKERFKIKVIQPGDRLSGLLAKLIHVFKFFIRQDALAKKTT